MSSEGNAKHNYEVLRYLCRGDLIKVQKKNENSYYVYSGNKEKLYPLHDQSVAFFSHPETKDERNSVVTFTEACGDSRCFKISDWTWMNETYGRYITIEKYNKKILKAILPGDILKFDKHHAIYIGNEEVIHLVSVSSKYGEMTERRKEEMKEFPHAAALVTADNVKQLSQNVKICKANRQYLHGYPEDQIIQRAKSQLGPAVYSWIYQNSRHFAEEMKYGDQVNRLVRSFSIGKSPSALLFQRRHSFVDVGAVSQQANSEKDGD